MPIHFACSCGAKLQALEQHAGSRVTCPDCGRKLFVPSPQAIQEPPGQPEIIEDIEEDRPRRPSRPRADDEAERPRPPARAAAEEVSVKATVALMLGAASFCLNVLAAVPAIILAVLSLGEIRRSGGRLTGKGLATAGLILACLGPILEGVGGYFGYRHFHPDKEADTDETTTPDGGMFGVRESANRATVSNNFHQMTIGMINDADTNNGRMMAPAIHSQDGKPLLSWRVTLLPWIEQDVLYHAFHLDEPWDSAHNIQFLSSMPKIYRHPNDPEGGKLGNTCYRVFTGPATAFPDPFPDFGQFRPFYDRGSCKYPASFADGTSQSILIVEAAETVPWTKPDELPYDPNKPLPKVGGWFRNGFHVGMGDGSVHFVSSKVSEPTFRAAITIAGNDVLGPDW